MLVLGSWGCVLRSALALCGGRLVRDARMRRMESTSGGSARLKAVPRRPAWEEDQEGCGAVTCGARKRRGRPGLAQCIACPWGAVSVPRRGRPGARRLPVRSRAGGWELPGEPPSGTGGGVPAPRRLCEWGCSMFQEGSAVPAPACALEREDGLCGEASPSSWLTPGPGRGSGWLRVGRAR